MLNILYEASEACELLSLHFGSGFWIFSPPDHHYFSMVLFAFRMIVLIVLMLKHEVSEDIDISWQASIQYLCLFSVQDASLLHGNRPSKKKGVSFPLVIIDK